MWDIKLPSSEKALLSYQPSFQEGSPPLHPLVSVLCFRHDGIVQDYECALLTRTDTLNSGLSCTSSQVREKGAETERREFLQSEVLNNGKLGSIRILFCPNISKHYAPIQPK